jgi:CRP-like cAMP-binding protein
MSAKPPPSRPPPGQRPKNRLLRALPAADYERLRPHLQTIDTPTRHVFHKHREPVEHVYFPNGGVASVTAVLSDGTMVETATVGLEGMVGIEAFFGKNPLAPGEAMMQVPDTNAEKLSVTVFRAELARQDALFDLMGRYAQTTVAQMMQSSACNARHQIHERCARWLLMTHDRVARDGFELSHEFLAMMLGVRRQSVTVVAGTLQSAGLITYKHGHISVLDRTGLEAASCECYALIRQQYDLLQVAVAG